MYMHIYIYVYEITIFIYNHTYVYTRRWRPPRGLLRNLCAELSKVDPEYPVHVHVDDLSHVLVAETASGLEEKLLEAGRIVGKEVKRLFLTLSTKSKVIPNNSTTRWVAKQLTKEGIPISAADTADDLGSRWLEEGSGQRRLSTSGFSLKVRRGQDGSEG